MVVRFSDIEDAFYYVSSASMYERAVILCRDTEEIFYTSELGNSDELPEDVDDPEKYISVPHKNALNLGKALVLEFSSERMPDDLRQVHAVFQRRGAYGRFKEFLKVTT